PLPACGEGLLRPRLCWSDYGQLLGAGEVELQGAEEAAESSWRLVQERSESAQAKGGAVLEVGVVCELGKAEQDVDGDGGDGGRCIVEEVPRAGYQRLVVLARIEEALDLVVPEQLDHLVRKLDSAGEIARFEGCGVSRHEGIDEASIVLKV